MAEMEELNEQFGEILMEMERFKNRAGGGDLGAVALVLDLAKAFERVGFPVFWPGRRTSASQGRCCYFEHQRRVQFKGCVAGPLQTITAILPGSKWSCMLLRVVLQDALGYKNLPPAKIDGLCGRHHSTFDGEKPGSG